ncbi:hypothetical protein [Psychrobium sp. 1_MG-2023]|uniref:hypothetical protein n=1 Tax=Psychrobium sp. 1_MG-2023 TaxID=3062624 RepID=UPI000CC295C3|nr:hypothetical protein [Psychrobium sp. 1_MG-2023]MDP2562329.1 hypothetical protein [Psychrobium sp. 1_MG-2023]PKF58061.1 hypothetical protein CW748_04475 [Alteromonadales bacterium alter-6D02]
MGRTIHHRQFTKTQFTEFKQRLDSQLEQLAGVISQPTFGHDPLKMGAELEYYLIDEQAQPSCSNQQLIAQLQDSQLQPELNQFNLELNLSPVLQHGRPFSQLQQELISKTHHINQAANKCGVQALAIGILPTLNKKHLTVDYMTDIPRYHCLAKHLYQQRHGSFKINIDGKEPLNTRFKDISSEGANASFQCHLMVPYSRFCDVYNAALLTLPLVTAIGANSPILLGHQLWDETRIALFKQSIDVRRQAANLFRSARVSFGHGWLRHSPWELFAQAVALYPPLIPQLNDDAPDDGLPKLSELVTHLGTIWPWLRPVYCPDGNGHIRLEFRAIPAGPSNVDMLATAAFAIGLANGLANNVERLLCVIPFKFAQYNFYRSAKHGLDAQLLWPLRHPNKPQITPIRDIITALFIIAEQGLQSLGVDISEVDYYLRIIEQRLERKINGAIWQKQTLTALEQTMNKEQACRHLVQLYLQFNQSEQPVTEWEQQWT